MARFLWFFDFGEQEYAVTAEGEMKQIVWSLLPDRIGYNAVVIKGSRKGLIKNLKESSQPLPWSVSELMRDFEEDLRKKERRRANITVIMVQCKDINL